MTRGLPLSILYMLGFIAFWGYWLPGQLGLT